MKRLRKLQLRARGREQGVAFVLTLLLVAILVALVAEFGYSTLVNVRIAENRAANLQHLYAAKGAVNFAKVLLLKDQAENNYDSLEDDWAAEARTLEFGSLILEAEITDETSKFNLNTLVSRQGKLDPEGKENLQHLARLYGLTSETIVPRILEMLEANHEDENEDEEGPYRLLKGPIFSADFAKVISVDSDEDFANIVSFCRSLTISSDGKVNINTAPKEVLMALTHELSESLAQSIIDYRKEHPFRGVGDLRKVTGMPEGIYRNLARISTVQSGFFTVFCKERSPGSAPGSQALVMRSRDRVFTIAWRERVAF